MDAMKDLRVFILIMVVLAFVWLFTGGPLRPSSRSGWFLDKPQQKASQKVQGQLEEALGNKAQSLPAGQESSSSSQSSVKPDIISLGTRRAKETTPEKEYIEIKADKKNKNSVKITGWKLEGKIGLDIEIGQGAYYYYPDLASQPKEDIYLKPGEKAVIISGRSPLGASFKLNKCFEHLEQFHKFIPSLNTDCPVLKNEDLPGNLSNDDQCLDYIDRVPACATILFIPHKNSAKLSSSCQNYVIENANYKSCSEKHKSDADFYLPEWRIYLDRSEEMWKEKRETITLYDSKNNIIDAESY